MTAATAAMDAHRPDSPTGDAAPGRRRRLAIILIAGLAALVYANSLANGFALDDVSIIVLNENAHGIDRVDEAVTTHYWYTAPASTGLYRPIAVAMYAIEWDLWDAHPAGYHAVNVALHALVSAFVLLLTLRLGASLTTAAAGAAVFAVHPVHTEVVANVVGRAELLSAAFFLGGLLVYLSGRGRGWRGALVGLLYFLALASKESAVTLPGVLLLVEAARQGAGRTLIRKVRSEWPTVLGLVAGLGVYLGVRYAVLGALVGNDAAPYLAVLSASDRLLTMIRVWPEYFRLLFFPLDLVADYSPAVLMPVGELTPKGVLGLVLALATAALTARAWRRARFFAVGVLWFCITIFTVSNLVVVVGITMAERTLYVPSVGLSFIVAAALAHFAGRGRRARRLAYAGLVLALVFGTVRTWTRNTVWRDTETVLNDLAASHPESFRIQWAIADQLAGQGRWEEARTFYDNAIEVNPGHYTLLFAYAIALMTRGQHQEAIPLLRAAIASVPEHVSTYVALANALSNADRRAEGRDVLRQAAATFPQHALLLERLARLEADLGRWPEALDAMERSIRLQGDDAGPARLRFLAEIHDALGDARAAARARRTAERLESPAVDAGAAGDSVPRPADTGSPASTGAGFRP